MIGNYSDTIAPAGNATSIALDGPAGPARVIRMKRETASGHLQVPVPRAFLLRFAREVAGDVNQRRETTYTKVVSETTDDR